MRSAARTPRLSIANSIQRVEMHRRRTSGLRSRSLAEDLVHATCQPTRHLTRDLTTRLSPRKRSLSKGIGNGSTSRDTGLETCWAESARRPPTPFSPGTVISSCRRRAARLHVPHEPFDVLSQAAVSFFANTPGSVLLKLQCDHEEADVCAPCEERCGCSPR